MASDAIQSGKHRHPHRDASTRTRPAARRRRASLPIALASANSAVDEARTFLTLLRASLHPVVAASLQTLVSASQLLADDPFQSATDGLIGLQAK
jgi:hypothetical protein